MGKKNKTVTGAKRVNIQLTEQAHTQAKLISVIKSVTMNEYFEGAIEQAIEKDKELLRKVAR